MPFFYFLSFLLFFFFFSVSNGFCIVPAYYCSLFFLVCLLLFILLLLCLFDTYIITHSTYLYISIFLYVYASLKYFSLPRSTEMIKNSTFIILMGRSISVYVYFVFCFVGEGLFIKLAELVAQPHFCKFRNKIC